MSINLDDFVTNRSTTSETATNRPAREIQTAFRKVSLGEEFREVMWQEGLERIRLAYLDNAGGIVTESGQYHLTARDVGASIRSLFCVTIGPARNQKMTLDAAEKAAAELLDQWNSEETEESDAA